MAMSTSPFMIAPKVYSTLRMTTEQSKSRSSRGSVASTLGCSVDVKFCVSAVMSLGRGHPLTVQEASVNCSSGVVIIPSAVSITLTDQEVNASELLCMAHLFALNSHECSNTVIVPLIGEIVSRTQLPTPNKMSWAHPYSFRLTICFTSANVANTQKRHGVRLISMNARYEPNLVPTKRFSSVALLVASVTITSGQEQNDLRLLTTELLDYDTQTGEWQTSISAAPRTPIYFLHKRRFR